MKQFIKQAYERMPRLATYIVLSLLAGFILLFILPDPANAVAFIACLCVPLYYIVYRIYTFKDK